MSIKEIRKELGLTQAGFARMFGVHQTAVSQWETGRTTPDTDMAIQIARGTGRSVDEVLGINTKTDRKDENETFEIEIGDDAMTAAHILKGDRAYVRENGQEISDGSLIGIRRNGADMVRFLRVIDDTMYLLDASLPARIEKVKGGDILLGCVVSVYSDFSAKRG